MTTTQVGMRCPECAKQRTKVRTLRMTSDRPVVTIALIAINVLIYFGGQTRAGFLGDYGLFGPAVADGEWWRLVTSGFLHGGLLHVGFNMYILWLLGQILEPALGPVRFAGLYLASLLAGSFGALVAAPHQLTVGASGAVFGLMAAAFVFQRARGIDPWRSGLGPVILLNLALPLIAPGLHISIGGHIGGLVGGALCGLVLTRFGRGHAAYSRLGFLGIAGLIAVGALAVAVSYWKVRGYA
jgi:membrane associated rhomboid family serine protease